MAAWMAFARTATKTSNQIISSANQSLKLIFQRRQLCNLACDKDPHGPPMAKSYAGFKFCAAVIYIGFWGYAIFGEVPKKKKKFKIVTVNDGVRDRRAIVEYRSFYHFGF
ncbi:uncharacterized protein LOC113345988 isoform X1 [Papaver somniferum]|uniref:uncharacterized protein LOC113345988 isoform X1 n=1 Tax=Papaver somniferum TaxID=3469 RepID=UPI000E6F99B5|nr:uncharacterized protein LOC113345988 isoform X1 [Papaver somniferum]